MTRCGTDAGYQAHMRAGIPPCAECQRARSEYMREYRRKNPTAYRKQRDDDNARNRALWRLARAHPHEFRKLVLDEQAKGRDKAAS